MTRDRRPTYALGHADRELERLATQARLIDPITRRFFEHAGIVGGMRVLDVGSGAGDVAMLAAELVGEAGEVIGTDPSASAVLAARARVAARSLGNVSFREGYPAEMPFERPFEAIIGRYVLEFVPDPASSLRKLASHLRPGGVIVFHELDLAGERSFPPIPSYDRCCRWIGETLRLLGADTRIGIKLHSIFVAAGLPPPSMRIESLIGAVTAGTDSDRLHLMADVARTLLPEIERLGVATTADVDVENLVARMQDELAPGGSVIIGRSEIGAWTRV